MARIIKSGLIQMSLPKTEGEGTIEEIKEAMVQKHIPYIERAGEQGVQILCLQEIFNTPYFCPGRTGPGMNRLKRCRGQLLNGWPPMPKNITW